MNGLTPPPCIEGLIGCIGSDGGSGTSGGSSTSGGSGSGGAGDGSFGLSSSSTSSIGGGGSFGIDIGSSLQGLGAAKERLLHYVVTVTNRGTSAVSNYAFSHGPLPSSATFDPHRSTQGCGLTGSSVQCVMNLAPSETKTVDLVYTAKTSLSCVIAKVLATVKNVTVNAGHDIVTSVSCSLKDSQGVASSAMSPVQMPAGNPGILAATLGQPNIQSIGLNYIEQPGYKPYVMPRTGARDILFSRTTEGVLTPVKHRAAEHDISLSSGLFAVVILATVAARYFRRGVRHVQI